MSTPNGNAPKIDHIIELQGVYDGWSIAIYTDGTIKNRWANDAGDGPEPGYERRWLATEDAIGAMRSANPEETP
jgi:hypothetical protein